MDPTYGEAGVPILFELRVRDNDTDALNVTWEWGDGTFDYTQTPPANPTITVGNSHAYNPVPEQGQGDYDVMYLMNVTLDDGNGNIVQCQTTVYVRLPPNGSPNIISVKTSAISIDPSDTVLIIANGSDPEGESLTWTYTFRNPEGEVYRIAVNHTPAAAPDEVVWSNITHVFGIVGRHTMRLDLSDALPPNQEYPHNVSTTISIDVVLNKPPGPANATINLDPASPVVTSELGYVITRFSIEAYDPDGDVFTVTWDFDDGTEPIVNVSSGGKGMKLFVQDRTYTDAGEFNVTVVISDGRPGHNVTAYRIVHINSTNLPPSIVSFFPVSMSGGGYALPNETLDFNLIISDPELDAVEVFIDFGDNSTIVYFFLSEYVDGNVSVTLSHTYSEQGNYTISVRYTDNKVGLFEHTKYYNLTIEIFEPGERELVRWSWWDYTSLGMVCMIPVLMVVWWAHVVGRRKQIEAQGMTFEEYKLLSSEMPEELERRQKEGG